MKYLFLMVSKIRLYVVSFSFLVSVGHSSYAAQLPEFLALERWEYRVVFVFAPSAESPLYQEVSGQLEALDCHIQDRDMVFGFFTYDNPNFNGTPLSLEQQQTMRDLYGVNNDASLVVLVGKDGSEKYRSPSWSAEIIFGRIDSMPMREIEMNESTVSC